MKNRLRQLKSVLRKKGNLPYLISDLNNIRYLTGFAGSYAMLLVTDGYGFFVSDSRYEEYARSILPSGVKFILQSGDFNFILKEMCSHLDVKELFLEENTLSLSGFLAMKKALRGIKLFPAGNAVNELRMVKDDYEISVLREAARITDLCVDHLCSFIKPGLTEWDVSVETEHFYRTHGCRRTSFDTIVAAGTSSSMPHYEPSMNRRIEKGDVILIDMGCEYEGYCSDLTRTFFLGKPDPRLKEIYGIVHDAQALALSSVRPGITTGELDAVARNFIAEAGYGDNFGHSLGHGYGLEIHELPNVKTNGSLELKKNMTITIEPGIYVPGTGGVRIEDMVLVTSGGGEVLTRSSKDLIVL